MSKKKNKGFIICDPIHEPGQLWVGGYGSGKSSVMKNTILTMMGYSPEEYQNEILSKEFEFFLYTGKIKKEENE